MQRRGASIVEVVIAVGMLTVVVVMMMDFFTNSFRMMDRIAQSSERERVAQAVIERLATASVTADSFDLTDSRVGMDAGKLVLRSSGVQAATWEVRDGVLWDEGVTPKKLSGDVLVERFRLTPVSQDKSMRVELVVREANPDRISGEYRRGTVFFAITAGGYAE